MMAASTPATGFLPSDRRSCFKSLFGGLDHGLIGRNHFHRFRSSRDFAAAAHRPAQEFRLLLGLGEPVGSRGGSGAAAGSRRNTFRHRHCVDWLGLGHRRLDNRRLFDGNGRHRVHDWLFNWTVYRAFCDITIRSRPILDGSFLSGPILELLAITLNAVLLRVLTRLLVAIAVVPVAAVDALRSIATVAPVTAIVAIAIVATVTAVEAVPTLTVTTVIAVSVAIAVPVAVAIGVAISVGPALLIAVVVATVLALVAIAAILARLRLLIVGPVAKSLWRGIEHSRLRFLTADRAVTAGFTELVAGLLGPTLTVRRSPRPVGRLTLLLAEGHDDAIVVLGVLKIGFGQDRIANRLGIACQGHVLFRDVRGISAYLHIRSVGLVAPRKRVLALSVVVVIVIVVATAATAVVAVTTAATATIVTAATSAVLLSLPHGLPISKFELSKFRFPSKTLMGFEVRTPSACSPT